jgi:hypothetical protein
MLLPPAMLIAHRKGEAGAHWWTTSRYLAWVGVCALIPPVVSGLLWARGLGLIPVGLWLAPKSASGQMLEILIRRHELLALCTVPLGVATLWGLHKRKGHWHALALSSLWALGTLATGYLGGQMTHPPEDVQSQTASTQELSR